MLVGRTFALGGDCVINRIGFGAMRLTGQPGNYGPYPEWEDGKAVLRRAVELGVTFIDTALSYGPRHNETLIAEALHPYPDGLVIATKGGVDKDARGRAVIDGSPATLLRQVDEALVRLKLDRIDLDRARAIAPIASVQNRYNRFERGNDALVDHTKTLGIAFIPYGPLGGDPMRTGAPLAPAEALAWLLDRAPNIICIPGTRSLTHLGENMTVMSQVSSTTIC